MARRQTLSDEKLYPPFKIAALVETLAEQGIDAERALSGTGLSPAQIHDRAVLTSVQQYIGFASMPCAHRAIPARPS